LRYKQCIIVRTDVKMGRGKLAAQVAHASLSAAIEAWNRRPEWFQEWLQEGQRKVVLRVSSKEELEQLYAAAVARGLPAAIISDAGLTQLPPGTLTAVAIGPAPSEMVDEITGKLKLL